MIRVVDISEWQGTVDFKKFVQAMKQGHVHGMIIRTGFGMYTEDSQAKRNIQKCNELNIPYGVYHYSYARNLAEAEIEVKGMLASLYKWGAKPTYPIVIDMEDADSWKKNNWLGGDYWKVQSDIVDYFCKEVEKTGGYAMWYASAHWVTNLSKYNNILENYDLWLAQWQVSAPEYSCGIWQYTAEGDIAPGVNGHSIGMETERLDLNYVYKNYPALISGVSQSKAEEKPKPTKTNVDLSQEVINGLWGDDDERKQRLTQAGYNYDAVQDIVNEKLLTRKPDTEMVAEILADKWGTGDERKQRLTQAGYNYDHLQDLVNKHYAKKSNEEIAREVIRGLWGDGKERFDRLAQAGYDGDAIQDIVNRLMK